MKLIIDIPDGYNLDDIQNGSIACSQVLRAVKNGIPYEERPQGKWIILDGVYRDENNPIDSDMYHCSICKRSIITTLTRPADLFPFCHCGADMREETENGITESRI